MNLNFTWKKKTGQYQSGESLYLNKIQIAVYSWSMKMKQGISWEGILLLPGLKNEYLYAATEEEIKQELELACTNWFKEALLERKD